MGPKKVSSRSRRSRPAASDLINHMRGAATGNSRPRAPTSRKCAHCPPRPPPPPLPAHCSACVNGASSCRSAVASHPSIHPSNLAFAAAAGSRTDSVDSDDDADNDAGDVVVLNGGTIPHTLSVPSRVTTSARPTAVKLHPRAAHTSNTAQVSVISDSTLLPCMVVPPVIHPRLPWGRSWQCGGSSSTLSPSGSGCVSPLRVSLSVLNTLPRTYPALRSAECWLPVHHGPGADPRPEARQLVHAQEPRRALAPAPAQRRDL